MGVSPAAQRCPATGKIRYRTEKVADAAMARILRSGDWKHKPVASYWCAKCGGWHLSSQAQR